MLRDPDQLVVVPDEVVFREVHGEAVLLNLSTGQYFGLDRVGTRMFRALADHGAIRAACDSLGGAYDIEATQLEIDLLEFVDTLAGRGLLRLLAPADLPAHPESEAAGHR